MQTSESKNPPEPGAPAVPGDAGGTSASPGRRSVADQSSAVSAALQLERESLARDLMLRRASMPTGGGGGIMGMPAGSRMGLPAGMMGLGDMGGMNTNMMAFDAGASGGAASGPGDESVMEKAIALRREQHRAAMDLHRRLLATNAGSSVPLDEAGKAAAAAAAVAAAASPRPSLGLGTTTGAGGQVDSHAAALSQARMAQAHAHAASIGAFAGTEENAAAPAPGAPSAVDQQALLRLAQIRTARAEVQAAQARLAELETHTALAASAAASTANDERDKLLRLQGEEMAAAAAAGPGGKSAKKSDDNADTRDLEAAEAFLSLSGRNQDDLPPGAVAAVAAAAAAGSLPAGMIMPAGMGLPGVGMGFGMEQPRRVSMDLLNSARNPGVGAPSAAYVAEALMAKRRLSNAASAAAIEAAARHRRITLPVVSGYGMEQALTMSALGGRKRKAGVDLPASGYDGMPTVDDYLVPSGVAVPTLSQTSGKSRTRPADAPRRPLSAYNFFFIDERERLLQAIKKKDEKGAGEESKKEGEHKNADKGGGDADSSDKGEVDEKGNAGDKGIAGEGGASKAGDSEDDPLEGIDLNDSTFTPSSYDDLMTLRLNNKEKPRPHRKTHGKIGFQTLAKLIASRWKALNEERREHYKSLAAIDMEKYKEKTAEYQKKKLARVEYGGTVGH